MAKRDPAKLTRVKVRLPFGIGEGEWTPDPKERRAAWSLYVELVTRIAVQPMELNQGFLREALSSLHSLFGSTRQILREAGPDVGCSSTSVGGIAIAVLNHEDGLRPVLARWHPLLSSWEDRRPDDTDLREHERAWQLYSEVRGDLEALRERLEQYAMALAEIAGVEHVPSGS